MQSYEKGRRKVGYIIGSMLGAIYHGRKTGGREGGGTMMQVDGR